MQYAGVAKFKPAISGSLRIVLQIIKPQKNIFSVIKTEKYKFLSF